MKQQIKISHLVTNGCSYTYCQGLDHPEKEGWPKLLADKLGVKVVNLAVMGSSNPSIHRRTYEYAIQNLKTNSFPLFVIGWTHHWRQEYYDNSLPGYRGIAYPIETTNLNVEQEYILHTWNKNEHFRRTLINQSSTKALFNSLNIPYLMSDFSNDTGPITQTTKNKYSFMINYIHDKFYPSPTFYDITDNRPKLPCQHHTKDTQHVLANIIYDKLTELFDISIDNSLPYLKLNQLNDTETENYSFSCWNENE